jgi:hypothetical protein
MDNVDSIENSNSIEINNLTPPVISKQIISGKISTKQHSSNKTCLIS